MGADSSKAQVLLRNARMTRGRSFWLLSIFALALSVVSAGQTPGQGPGPGAGGQRPAAPGTGDRFPQRPGLPGSMRPMRDSAAPLEEGTGRIRGRVTDDAGQPLRRVSVSTMGGQARQPRVALTDADGRYELTGLPAASYYITAAKGAYVRQSYGQRTSTGPGRPIEVALGQTVDKIDFTLPRGGIIVGRVVDEFGEPMAESSVMATRFVNN
jgi:hypothetical protein